MNKRSLFDAVALAERVLRTSFSEEAARSVLGDLLEEVERRTANKKPVRLPGAWLVAQALMHATVARTGRRPSATNPSYGGVTRILRAADERLLGSLAQPDAKESDVYECRNL
jgi:hypothetical protein